MAALDTQALRAFVAVIEHNSFSAAAEALHITQPAVSKRVAVLENQLNTKLFDRIHKRIFLTEAGRALLPKARSILQELEEAQRIVNDIDGKIAGTLSIAFSHHIGLHRLPPFLKSFTKRYPDVDLDIDFLDSEKAYDLILEGKIELAVITLTPDTHEEITATPLWKDPLAFMCSPDHILHLKNNVTLTELSTLEAILPGMNTYTGKIVRQTFAEQNINIQSSMVTNYLETIKMMVSIGLGWSVLPKTMKDSLEVIHVPDVYIERTLGVIEHRGRQPSNSARAFKSMLLT